MLDFTIVNVALPSIQRDLHVATTTLQWVISGYAVAFGGFLLLGGRLADAYSPARLYRIGLVVFTLASISGGLAVEPVLLITSRVVQGMGAAMLAPAGLSLLVTSWPGDKERARALGTYGAIVSAGFASGAVLGGLLVEITWRLVFFVNVPIGIAQPEPLEHGFQGYWSRRITDEHRLVHKIADEEIRIAACQYHYER